MKEEKKESFVSNFISNLIGSIVTLFLIFLISKCVGCNSVTGEYHYEDAIGAKYSFVLNEDHTAELQGPNHIHAFGSWEKGNGIVVITLTDGTQLYIDDGYLYQNIYDLKAKNKRNGFKLN